MRARFSPKPTIAAAVAAMSSACSLPQPAIDQANNGAALIGVLQAELKEFRAVQSRIAEERLASIRRQRVRLYEYEADGAFDERLLRAAGKTDALQLYTTLKEIDDERARDKVRLDARVSELDATLVKLLQPLPELSKEIRTAQQSLAVLGEERSTGERLKATTEFAALVIDGVEMNRGKIHENESRVAAEAAKALGPVVQSAPK